MADKIEIRPQEGPQAEFLACHADIVIYGGAAGGGKSYALLIEALRHVRNVLYGAVIFRRQGVEIRKEGGLWDESQKIFSQFGGIAREGYLDWQFPYNPRFPRRCSRISFSHLENEKDKYTWQGAQIAYMGFDELTHFTKSQFFYMLSRNRSTSGVRPYIRCTTNPDADSWVAEFIAWWINWETGYPIPDRSGIIRYFLRQGEDLMWGDTKEELIERYPDFTEYDIKSITFISSTVFDNKILLEKDPGYLGNLKALAQVDRERLLKGNWKIRPSAGLYFRREYFEIVDAAPAVRRKVRRWDLAGTQKTGDNDPDFTVGLLASRAKDGIIYVEDIRRDQISPKAVEQMIVNTASQDGHDATIGLPQDPGQAGKSQIAYLTTSLAGYKIESERETGDKITRASPASAQAEAGNIKLVRGPWNEAFITELVNFPTGAHDDQVDTLSGAVSMLIKPERDSLFTF